MSSHSSFFVLAPEDFPRIWQGAETGVEIGVRPLETEKTKQTDVIKKLPCHKTNNSFVKRELGGGHFRLHLNLMNLLMQAALCRMIVEH